MRRGLIIIGGGLLVAVAAASIWLFSTGKLFKPTEGGSMDTLNFTDTATPTAEAASVSTSDSVAAAGSASPSAAETQSASNSDLPVETDSVKASAETLFPNYASREILPGVWDITDSDNGKPFVDIFLIEGADRALVIDAGLSDSDLPGYIKTLTDKPFELALSHGHDDHVAAAHRFDAIHMSSQDFDLIKPFTSFTDFDTSGMHDLRGGETFDLGGCKLEVLALPGHTTGSVAFLDRERQLLFSGDALGSGSLWMQLRESTTVEAFRDDMREFVKSLEGLDDLKLFVGHDCLMSFKADRSYITDVLTASEKIVSGEITGGPSGRPEFPGSVSVAYGKVFEFLYRTEKVLKGGN